MLTLEPGRDYVVVRADRARLAAEHLRDTAEALRAGETIGGEWPDRTASEKRVHREHDEMLELAAELEEQ